jgi:hypothetical protein
VGQLTAHCPQPESDDQHCRIGGGGPIDDHVAVNLRRGTVRKSQLKTDAPFRQMNPPFRE